MSEIKVNKVSPATGTAIQLGDSGDTFTVPSGCTITNSGTATGFGGGKLLQCLSQVYTTVGSTSNTFPNDNTKPQITEGVEIMTQAITPASSSNILIIQGVVNIGTGTTGSSIQFALFQDSTADCLAAWNTMPRESNMSIAVPYFYRMVAGTTSSTTFKIRYAGQGNTTYVNQLSGGNTYDSSYNSSMCVSEISA